MLTPLFAWCLFETYRRFCDDAVSHDPLGDKDEAAFQPFLQECGFHTLDVSPCADGRLAHVLRYVLRLPYKAVRRRSYAGAMFDIDDSLADQLDQIAAPTLVLVGNQDILTPRGDSEELHELIPTAELVVISHGHYDHTGGLAAVLAASEIR